MHTQYTAIVSSCVLGVGGAESVCAREFITFTVEVHITFILATIVYELDEVTVISINDKKAVKTTVVYLPILPSL